MSKVLCLFCFEICPPEGRGGEKGGSVNFKTKQTESLARPHYRSQTRLFQNPRSLWLWCRSSSLLSNLVYFHGQEGEGGRRRARRAHLLKRRRPPSAHSAVRLKSAEKSQLTENDGRTDEAGGRESNIFPQLPTGKILNLTVPQVG